MTMTDPMYVLPAAVEAAQRTASEIVVEAIRAAETAGYERGKREARPAAEPVALLALLKRATALVAEAEETTSGIDGLCDDLSVRTKRRATTIQVPDTGDSFDEVRSFMADHGGSELIDPDDAEVNSDEVREAAEGSLGDLRKIGDLIAEIRALLGVPDENADDDTESPHPSLDAHMTAGGSVTSEG